MKGSITIFLSLCLTICIALICTILEAARLKGLVNHLDMAADSALDSVFSEYNRTLLNQYGLLFLDGGFGNKTFSEQMLEEKITEYLKYELYPSCDRLLAGITLYPMETETVALSGIVKATDFGGSMFAQEVIDYMKYREVGELVEKIIGWKESLERGEGVKAEIDGAKRDMEDTDWNVEANSKVNVSFYEAGQKKKGITADVWNGALKDKGQTRDFIFLTMEESQEESKNEGDNGFDQERYEKEMEGSVIHKADELKNGGFLKLVVPSGTPISAAPIKSEELPSITDKEPLDWTNKNIVENVGREVLYNEYLIQYFTNFLSKEESNGPQYELEYILFGKGTDEDNLKTCVNRLLWMREGLNIAHIISSGEKMEEALGMATTLLGWTLLPPLITAAQLVIVGVWAYGEALLDVRHLLEGKKVGLLKTEESWNLSLAGLMDFFDGHISEKAEEKDGLSYQDYLRVMLFLQERSEKYYRTMDMIQINVQKTNPEFLMKNCVYALEMTVNTHAKCLFFSLPIIANTARLNRGSYSLSTSIGRNY